VHSSAPAGQKKAGRIRLSSPPFQIREA